MILYIRWRMLTTIIFWTASLWGDRSLSHGQPGCFLSNGSSPWLSSCDPELTKDDQSIPFADEVWPVYRILKCIQIDLTAAGPGVKTDQTWQEIDADPPQFFELRASVARNQAEMEASWPSEQLTSHNRLDELSVEASWIFFGSPKTESITETEVETFFVEDEAVELLFDHLQLLKYMEIFTLTWALARLSCAQAPCRACHGAAVIFVQRKGANQLSQPKAPISWQKTFIFGKPLSRYAPSTSTGAHPPVPGHSSHWRWRTPKIRRDRGSNWSKKVLTNRVVLQSRSIWRNLMHLWVANMRSTWDTEFCQWIFYDLCLIGFAGSSLQSCYYCVPHLSGDRPTRPTRAASSGGYFKHHRSCQGSVLVGGLQASK